jgi:putative Ca2+/H+ antiporter (TMEM165/GDT1 family)
VGLTAVLVTFGVIFLAELPDKTMVASLVLGSRFRPLYVWAGVAVAFAIHVAVAVAAGSAFALLPNRIVDVITALLFAVGAVLVLREGRSDDHDPAGGGGSPTGGDVLGGPVGPTVRPSSTDPGSLDVTTAVEAADGPDSPSAAGEIGFWRVAATSFMVVFIAEMGDLTQISTANLAARFASPVAVAIGAALALWTVAGLASAGGRGLLRVLSIRVITRIAAGAFAVLAAISMIEAIRG